MEELFRNLVRELEAGRSCVLATVVRTGGSTPQKAGARMLIKEDGTAVGTLGGGCVEHDIQVEAVSLFLKESPRPYIREYLLNEELDSEHGLVCGGRMEFLIEPLSPEALPLFREVLSACQGGPPLARAVLLRPETGRKLVLRGEGREGSLGDPELEEKVAGAVRNLGMEGLAECLLKENGAEVFIEVFAASPRLVIFGAGHVGRALSKLARAVGFRVTVVDDREDYANRESFPDADEIVVADFPEAVDRLSLTPGTAVVIATRGHQHDFDVLARAIWKDVWYLGMIGSRRKVLLIFEELMRRGIPPERIARVYAPIGLGIGARTPEEIALSILAEMVMLRRGGDGRPMKIEVSKLHVRGGIEKA